MIDSDELTTTDSVAPPTDGTGVSPWLRHHWAVAGIVAASSIFIPVPFVDEYVQRNCRRFAVRRTLAAHGMGNEIEAFEPYFDGSGGLLSNFRSFVLKLPLKLILFPIRKPLNLIRSVHDAPLEIVRTILLARELHRALSEREAISPHDQPPAIEPEQVLDFRRAFDKAFSRIDLHVLQAATRDVYSASTRLLSAVVWAARWRSPNDEDLVADLEANSTFDVAARKVESAMERPAMLDLFREFDGRFDRALQEVREQRLAPEAAP